jgi:hypothetical protein
MIFEKVILDNHLVELHSHCGVTASFVDSGLLAVNMYCQRNANL